MKAGRFFVMIALLSATQVIAQQQPVRTNALALATNSVDMRLNAPMELRLTQQQDTNSLNFVAFKRDVRVSGSLIRPLKAKSASDFGRRVVHLFSPFADESNSQTPQVEPVSSKAWSTIVGWTPAQSAFPDDSRHDPPMLRLISVGVEKQP